MNSRIALGTVQFGLNYGVANQGGQIKSDEARAIVTFARSHGVCALDTAIAYGDSEQVLGRIGVGNFEVISKLAAVPENCSDVRDWVLKQVQESLHRLRVPQLYGLLLHHPEQLLSGRGPELYEALQILKNQGLVAKTGISIYRPEELQALFKIMKFDLVQAPFNLLDRRLITTGWLDRLHMMGVELHVRSVFLQGLLLMPLGQRPSYFDRWSKLWHRYDEWLKQHNITPVQACLRHALSVTAINKLVVGVDSCTQLLEILAATQGELPPIPEYLNCDDVDLLNPASWSLA
jgi:aryl-alcohol dehydrogenase-like predicted oxidoreductase